MPIARYAFTHVHTHCRVRVPQMPGVQNPCKCPTTEHHIKFRHPPRVPKAREDPSLGVFFRNWPENICADRTLCVHLYWRVRVPRNCQMSRACKAPPREHHSASRHPPRVPKARGDPCRCFSSRNCPESHLSLVPRVKDDPCAPFETVQTQKSTHLGPDPGRAMVFILIE